MKYKYILPLVLAIAFSGNLRAQYYYLESLGGVKTEFEFVSGTTDLQVDNQVLIGRAEKKVSYMSDKALAMGYQSLHLEFVTTKDLYLEYNKNKKGKYRMTFYDHVGNVLADIPISTDKVDLLTNKEIPGSPCFYSIDLIDIPITLLSQSRKINFYRVTSSKKN